MPLSTIPKERRQLIVLGQAGAVADEATIKMMDLWWDAHDDKGEYQDLYVLREALQFLTAPTAKKYDVKVGTDEAHRSQMFNARMKLLTRIDKQIDDLEKLARTAARGGSVKATNSMYTEPEAV